MKYLLLFCLLLFGSNLYASVTDCYGYLDQREKDECMSFERDQAVGHLMTSIGVYCSEKESVKKSQGKKSHSMKIDECMAKELEDLAIYVEQGDR